jgi:hypothetical protein
LNKILLEKKLAKEKKGEKKADKDYDGDGEVETGSEEFLGSRDKAIKANMAKKTDKSKKSAKKAKKKKKQLKEGTEVQAGNFIYGGFPRVLNEVEVRLAKGNANPDEERELAGRPDPDEDLDLPATHEFNDADDGPGEPSVATMSDAQEVLWSDPSLVHGGQRYPSKALMGLAQQAETLQQQYVAQRRSSPNFETSPAGTSLGRQAYDAQMQLYRHPHFMEFQQGHPSQRNRPTKSATYAPGTVIDSSREGT